MTRRKASFLITKDKTSNDMTIECWDGQGFTMGSTVLPLEHAETLGLALIRFSAFHNLPTMPDGTPACSEAIDSVEFSVE